MVCPVGVGCPCLPRLWLTLNSANHSPSKSAGPAGPAATRQETQTARAESDLDLDGTRPRTATRTGAGRQAGWRDDNPTRLPGNNHPSGQGCQQPAEQPAEQQTAEECFTLPELLQNQDQLGSTRPGYAEPPGQSPEHGAPPAYPRVAIPKSPPARDASDLGSLFNLEADLDFPFIMPNPLGLQVPMLTSHELLSDFHALAGGADAPMMGPAGPMAAHQGPLHHQLPSLEEQLYPPPAAPVLNAPAFPGLGGMVPPGTGDVHEHVPALQDRLGSDDDVRWADLMRGSRGDTGSLSNSGQESRQALFSVIERLLQVAYAT
jgi:hypothetical protein